MADQISTCTFPFENAPSEPDEEASPTDCV
jgi:hypothetical protein